MGRPASSFIRIQIANEQRSLAVENELLTRAVTIILQEAGIQAAQVSLAIVDDPAMHGLNLRYLSHDCPTDVLSFLLDRQDDRLEGEIIVSADTAIRAAAEYGWQATDELLLYIIHGTLHLIGLDDATPSGRDEMRLRERQYLAQFGLEPRYDL